MTSSIKLGDLKIDAVEFASQGNAILGIRDSGKSYTATWLAERLLDAGIPFVAFDPIGVWRHLRVPGRGAGYPVVVAGGAAGDLPLTPASAPEIVRAAMREGVSLVLDLYSMDLSKSDWKRIVEACVRLMLYENKAHGLRHIFIEEAAEFVPQRVGPDQGRVYAEIEKLARMGGNAQLGYTLVNQRAEEVNKAVLELCDCLFLHRQKGRNSLTALGKWLDVADATGGREIIKSLPLLAQGECWVWASGSGAPARVKVPEKRTHHPDRRAARAAAPTDAKRVDVGSFVSRMSTSLEKSLKEAEGNDPSKLRQRIAELERAAKTTGNGVPETEVQRRVAETVSQALAERPALAPAARRQLEEAVAAHHALLLRAVTAGEQLVADVGRILATACAKPTQAKHSPTPSPSSARPALPPIVKRTPAGAAPAEGLTRPQHRILDSLARLEAFGMAQAPRETVAVFAEASPTSSAYMNNLGALRGLGAIDYPSPGDVTLTELGRAMARVPDHHSMGLRDIHEAWLSAVTNPQAAILRALIAAHPKAMTREDLAEEAGASVTSSAYMNNLGALRTLSAIEYPARGTVRASKALFP